MQYVETVVNSAGGRASTFVYSCEPSQGVTLGSLILVPFATAEAQAIVVGCPEQPPDLPIKPIVGVVDSLPVVSAEHIALARWVAQHYCCSFLDALLPMLPPGVARRPQTLLSLVPGVDVPPDLTEGEFVVREALRAVRRLPLDQVRALLDSRRLARQTDRIVRRLVEGGVVRQETSIRPPVVRPREEWFVRLAGTVDEAEVASATLGRSDRQRKLLARLISVGSTKEVPLATLREEAVGSLPLARSLAEKGFAVLERREVRRDPLAFRSFPGIPAPALTEAQEQAWREIRAGLDEPGYHPYLLHGITGSGKTEIYLRLIAALLERGKRAIVLVPEISLTPQTIQRFAGRFPGRLAVVHSRLTPGERFDEWRRIRSGLADVVVGSRSAIFAPVANLGGIVVDEEHEWSYKHERAPRYHARDAALKLAEIAGLTIVLGSATPSLESYHAARRGSLRLLSLPNRVESAREGVTVGATRTNGPALSALEADARARGLPPVELVDLRTELREGNRSIFSTRLREAITQALSLREQTILFLNRRGDSTFVLCRDCGFVMRCGRCDASLVYHSDVDDLVCHLCDARLPMPGGCTACWGEHIRYFGVGTQKLEAETRRLFPQARVLRWDRDAARARGAHEELLRAFTNHEADILVGTQMIAKGLDLPLVTLVGVLSADMSLHLPDLRAAERTFQLLTQVAGRAGRGPLGGKVIVQAYTPEHYCIQAAQTHDYVGFYEREIAFRREHGYPPFGELARLLHVGYGEARVERDAKNLAAQIRYVLRRDALDRIEVIGPAPAYHQKIRGRYRWQIVLRGHHLSEFVSSLDLTPGWVADIDPVSTL